MSFGRPLPDVGGVWARADAADHEEDVTWRWAARRPRGDFADAFDALLNAGA